LALAIGVLLGGVLWLGTFARQQLRDQQRFQVAFSNIECNAPDGMPRPDFLEEVQYLGRLPERFSIFDDGLREILQVGFAKHPWVAEVRKVDLVPPRSVRVSLSHRQAALAVVVSRDLAGEGLLSPLLLPENETAARRHSEECDRLSLRAVDAEAVLLPKKVPSLNDLPILRRAPRPVGGEGQSWGDPGVHFAAQTAEQLKAQLRQADIKWMTWSKQGLILWGQGFKLIWGRPGALANEEVSAAVKEQRLTQLIDMLEPPGLWKPWMPEYDLRPRQAISVRLVIWESPN
jgi:hypothetical protein